MKALSYRACRGAKIRFQSATKDLFNLIAQYWSVHLRQFVTHACQNERHLAMLSGEIALYAIKTLKGFMVYGLEDWNKLDYATQFMQQLLQDFSSILNSEIPEDFQAIHQNIAKTIASLYMHSQHQDPRFFASTIGVQVIQFSFDQIVLKTASPTVISILIKMVQNVIAGLDRIDEYKGNQYGQHLLNEVLLPEPIAVLAENLIRGYFVMSESDIEIWRQDPVGFLQEEEMEDYIRPKAWAEKLFVSLLIQWPNVVVPIISRLYEETCKMASTSDIMLREACYLALTITSYHIVDHFDIYTLLPSLLAEVQTNAPGYEFLYRRIALLLSSWITEIHEEHIHVVYEVVVYLLSHGDFVVSMAAVHTIQSLVNDLSFKVALFEKHLDATFSKLFSILSIVSDKETHYLIFSVIGSLIDEIDQLIQPYAEDIIAFLFQIWDQNDDNIMRMSVLRTLAKLAIPMEGLISRADTIFPMIRYSTSVNQQGDNSLLEDGMLLWLSVIRSSPAFDQRFFDLFENFLPILERGFSTIIYLLCIKLLMSYIILGGRPFIERFVAVVGNIYADLIGTTKDDVTKEILTPIDTMIMIAPDLVSHHMQTSLVKILRLLFSSDETDRVKCFYMNTLNRLLLHNPLFAKEMFDHLSHQYPQQGNFLVAYVNQMLEMFDSIEDLNRRKTAAISLCHVLPWIPSDSLLLTIQSIIGVSMDEEEGEGPPLNSRPDDTYVAEDVYVPELRNMSLQGRQLQALYENDPVNNQRLRSYFTTKLNELQQINPELVQSVLSELDSQSLKYIQ